MRTLFIILIVAALALVIAGCAKKTEQTKAVQVENPQTEAAPVKAPAPAPAPTPAAPAVKAVKGYTMTSSGLQYKDTKVGKGPAVKAGDTALVNYKGWLDDGTVFDSSKKPGRTPFSVENVGSASVIPGWNEGLQGMKAGGVRVLIIPSKLGYGETGSSPDIGPNATLHFEIELLKIGS